MDLWTRLRVESATDGTSRITRETVARETPASAAISRRVTRDFRISSMERVWGVEAEESKSTSYLDRSIMIVVGDSS
jgi:hypothetical protein